MNRNFASSVDRLSSRFDPLHSGAGRVAANSCSECALAVFSELNGWIGYCVNLYIEYSAYLLDFLIKLKM